MPYSVTQTHPDCSGFGVTKDDDGALMGCHLTQAEANEQIAALYAAEADQYDRSEVTLVWGPPCGGKSTLVQELAERGDLILDSDLLHGALSALGPHDHDPTVSTFVRVAWDALLRALQGPHSARAFVMAGVPTRTQRGEMASVLPSPQLVSADRPTCNERASAAGRPDAWHFYIDRWHDLYEPELPERSEPNVIRTPHRLRRR